MVCNECSGLKDKCLCKICIYNMIRSKKCRCMENSYLDNYNRDRDPVLHTESYRSYSRLFKHMNINEIGLIRCNKFELDWVKELKLKGGYKSI